MKAPEPTPESLERKACDLRCPPEWTGHWSEWHRGHGCKQEIRAGSPSPEPVAPSPEEIAREIVPIALTARNVAEAIVPILDRWRARLYLAAKIEGTREGRRLACCQRLKCSCNERFRDAILKLMEEAK